MAFLKGHVKTGGRKPGTANYIGSDVKGAARHHTEACVAFLRQVVDDEGAEMETRIHAAGRLLEFAWGRPAQQVDAPDTLNQGLTVNIGYSVGVIEPICLDAPPTPKD